MDRIESALWEDRNEHRRAGSGAGAAAGSAEDMVLPSRNLALVGIRSALEEGRGPLLLTGEAGVGKTWLAERLYAGMPAEWRWLVVNVSPALDPFDLYSMILNGFGAIAARHLAEAQGLLADTLRDAAADGWRWGLTLDEAHNASPEVYEEIRLLSNALGRDSGFAGILLVGQTPMVRTLATRSMRALEARLAARVHLRPLDVDEFAAWVMSLPGVRVLHEADLEFLHRAVRGNPGRFLREVAPKLAMPASIPATPVRESLPPTAAPPAVEPAPPSEERPWDVPPVVPSKPPLQVADEMIEVGWDASTELTPALKSSGDNALAPSEERVDDHYAALQAWNEWAQSQGREPDADPAESDLPDASTAELPEGHGTNVRAESEHDFAPYSQLFSRLRAAKE